LGLQVAQVAKRLSLGIDRRRNPGQNYGHERTTGQQESTATCLGLGRTSSYCDWNAPRTLQYGDSFGGIKRYNAVKFVVVDEVDAAYSTTLEPDVESSIVHSERATFQVFESNL
jgi:hypothetical protein